MSIARIYNIKSQPSDLLPDSCATCEMSDIGLTKSERSGYTTEGCRKWCNKKGVPLKKSSDKDNLICSLTGTSTTADSVCPLYARAKTIWQ